MKRSSRHSISPATRPICRLLATLAIIFSLFSATAPAQFELATPPTTADLRGIDNVGNGVAWASGTNGTVVRTEDDGFLWQRCSVPPGAEHLDFRGVQAFDANTAIVMSSSTGPLSRLYKTTDGCQTWTLLFTNPDPEGFWDAIQAFKPDNVEIVGDSVDHTLVSGRKGHVLPVWHFSKVGKPASHSSDHFFQLAADPGEGSFAASNSSLAVAADPPRDPIWTYQWLASQNQDHSYVHREATERTAGCKPCRMVDVRVETPMSQGTPSAGIFSIAFREDRLGVVVGGDYQKPNATSKTAAYSTDTGSSWQPAQTMPHGFRSAVAYDAPAKTWIAVGPNGTDISTDDGRNWRALKPDPKFNDAPDADQHWNALSLPFVVGPHGRIGKLRPLTSAP